MGKKVMSLPMAPRRANVPLLDEPRVTSQSKRSRAFNQGADQITRLLVQDSHGSA